MDYNDLKALLTSHGYNWPDLREVGIGTQGVGGVLFSPDAGEAYSTAKDGRVQGLWMAYELRGTAWKITARDGDTYTVVRHDGKASQTFTRPAGWKTLAVAAEAVSA